MESKIEALKDEKEALLQQIEELNSKVDDIDRQIMNEFFLQSKGKFFKRKPSLYTEEYIAVTSTTEESIIGTVYTFKSIDSSVERLTNVSLDPKKLESSLELTKDEFLDKILNY